MTHVFTKLILSFGLGLLLCTWTTAQEIPNVFSERSSSVVAVPNVFSSRILHEQRVHDQLIASSVHPVILQPSTMVLAAPTWPRMASTWPGQAMAPSFSVPPFQFNGRVATQPAMTPVWSVNVASGFGNTWLPPT